MNRNGFCLAAALLLLIAGSMTGCKRELPSPWKEVRFPLDHAEILPGADEKGFQASYPAGTPAPDLFREYQRALEAAGWAVKKEGTSHDPVNGSFAVIMTRGSERVLMTVVAGKPVNARVTTSVD